MLLTDSEAATRLAEYGFNVMAKDQRAGLGKLLWRALLNPLVILLAVLATISLATGDSPGAAVMASMIALSVALKLIQESKAGNAAAKLKGMISVTATVLRGGAPREIAVAQLVPGDVVRLAAGDMIPGDVRIVQAKDLFVVQGSLTGESFPVEKLEVEKKTTGAATAPIELTSIAFLGTSVESGSASAVIVATGKDTYLGGMAQSLQDQPTQTSFDRGIAQFTWLMLLFMLVMVPLVFLNRRIGERIVAQITAARFSGFCRDTMRRRGMPWADNRLKGRIRFKLLKLEKNAEPIPRYYLPDVRIFAVEPMLDKALDLMPVCSRDAISSFHDEHDERAEENSSPIMRIVGAAAFLDVCRDTIEERLIDWRNDPVPY